MSSLKIVIIRKNGKVQCDSITNFRVNEIADAVHEWKINNGTESKYKLLVYGEVFGKFNMINKYEFPPPIDKEVFYGDVFVLAYRKINKIYKETDLSVDMWNVFYKDMFCFEDLQKTVATDEREVDELQMIPVHRKTRDGYLMDGFVVDDDEEDEDY